MNVPALVCDALEGIIWMDDEQVTSFEVIEYRCQPADCLEIQSFVRTTSST